MSAQAVPSPIVAEALSSRVGLPSEAQSTIVRPIHQIVGANVPLEMNIIIHELSGAEDDLGNCSSGAAEPEALPPYLEEPPAYSLSGPNEPVTLAMYLFKFGILFPPFWIMGALILFSPLREPEPSEGLAWLPEKTESERREIIEKMRATEVKWARRCLLALSVLLLVGVVIGLTVWGILRFH